MAKQNAYLAKQEAVQRQCFNDGWELGTQQMCDYISLALREAYKGNGETSYPFRERYDCLKEYDYKAGKWRE